MINKELMKPEVTMSEVTIRMIEVFLTAFKQDKRKKVATQIYNAMFTIGYRKVSGEPPILSDKEIDRAKRGFCRGLMGGFNNPVEASCNIYVARGIAQAQRDADIRFYEV